MSIYLNLTNGIEALEVLKHTSLHDIKFVRIQSTACEQKRWDFILQELDYNFLMGIALGETITVVDYSATKGQTRAVYQGLEFIKYVLNKYWLNKEYTPNVKGFNCSEYFKSVYDKLDKRTFKKLEYFKKFLTTSEIRLKSMCFKTEHDGDYKYYSILLNNVTTF